MVISIPPLEEQIIILKILNKIIVRNDEAFSLIELEKEIIELKQSILNKEFRGEMGTNNSPEVYFFYFII
ncbi:hypothetical protein V7138_21450 [Bacillus sp. JJ1533]|uniref:hypothetical protein n=1 Tax=Bacillus sp. JJ1533 TaxID=3122959 RepID=UPI003000E1CD